MSTTTKSMTKTTTELHDPPAPVRAKLAAAWKTAEVACGCAVAGAGVTAGRTEVVIVDDDPRIRRDFSMILGLEDDLAVVEAVADGAAAVECCRRLRPAVVVMDVRMPVMDGIEATRHIRDLPDDPCRVLSVTTFDLDDYVLGTIRAGASGFLLKDQAPRDIAPAVRMVARGDGIVSPRATARLLQELVRPADNASRPSMGADGS